MLSRPPPSSAAATSAWHASSGAGWLRSRSAMRWSNPHPRASCCVGRTTVYAGGRPGTDPRCWDELCQRAFVPRIPLARSGASSAFAPAPGIRAQTLLDGRLSWCLSAGRRGYGKRFLGSVMVTRGRGPRSSVRPMNHHPRPLCPAAHASGMLRSITPGSPRSPPPLRRVVLREQNQGRLHGEPPVRLGVRRSRPAPPISPVHFRSSFQ